MNCADFERLTDAYLDGELSGSLRLEFDAHRLRCRSCQLTVAMMESVGHVIVADRSAPTVSDDFTDRVMLAIDRKRPLSLRLRSTRVAVVAGTLLQAAAVLYLALMIPSQSPVPPLTGNDQDSVAATFARPDLDEKYALDDRKVDKHEEIRADIIAQIEALGVNLASDVNRVAEYALALSVPDDYVRGTHGLNEPSPWGLILQAISPGEPAEAEPSMPQDQHSL